MLPEPIKKFVDLFSNLPSIGPRQATRLAFYLASLGKEQISQLAQSLAGLQQLKRCPSCFATYQNPEAQCLICLNSQRRRDVIMVVEKETDLVSLEKTKKFAGRYLVLGELRKTGLLEPEQKLRINSLKNLIKKEGGGQAEEIILAINPTTYGDLNAATLAQEFKDFAKKITRLGRGIPTGGEIEFADEDTLSGALSNRS